MAMLLLAVSSVPVHRELYLKNAWTGSAYRIYIAALLIIVGAAAIGMGLIALLLETPLSPLIVSIFVVEKLLDELARAKSYQKKLVAWECITFARAAIPLLIVSYSLLAVYDYVGSMTAAYTGLAGLLITVLIRELKIPSKENMSNGVKLLYNSFLYGAGGLMTGFIRQGPKNMMLFYSPGSLQIYLMASQICSVFNILYNVKFQVPFRALMSKRPRRYAYAMKSINRTLVKASIGLAGVSGLLLFSCEGSNALVIALIIAAFAEAIAVTVFTNIASMPLWAFSRKKYLITVGSVLSGWVLLVFIGFEMAQKLSVKGELYPSMLVTICGVCTAMCYLYVYFVLRRENKEI